MLDCTLRIFCIPNFISVSTTSTKKMYGRNCKYNATGVFKVHNSVKIFSIVPKIELDLDVIQTDLITKFQLNMFIICEENEWKLQLIEIFLRGITM